MSSLRTETILALEKLRDDSSVMVAKGLELNEFIRQNKMPIPLFDVVPAWNIQAFAEGLLTNIELKARGVSRLVRRA